MLYNLFNLFSYTASPKHSRPLKGFEDGVGLIVQTCYLILKLVVDPRISEKKPYSKIVTGLSKFAKLLIKKAWFLVRF